MSSYPYVSMCIFFNGPYIAIDRQVCVTIIPGQRGIHGNYPVIVYYSNTIAIGSYPDIALAVFKQAENIITGKIIYTLSLLQLLTHTCLPVCDDHSTGK